MGEMEKVNICQLSSLGSVCADNGKYKIRRTIVNNNVYHVANKISCLDVGWASQVLTIFSPQFGIELEKKCRKCENLKKNHVK